MPDPSAFRASDDCWYVIHVYSAPAPLREPKYGESGHRTSACSKTSYSVCVDGSSAKSLTSAPVALAFRRTVATVSGRTGSGMTAQ